MTYEINPCEACWKKFQKGNCNINELNNCLVDTATAFSQFPSNNSIRGNSAGKNWHDCIKGKMETLPEQAGGKRNFCNFELNMAPSFVQVPHFFPQRLMETQDKEKALSQALEDCKHTKLPNECKLAAETDYDSVIEIKNNTVSSSPPQPQPPSPPSPTYGDIAKQDPLVFWPFFLGWAIVLALILAMFIKTLFSNKIGTKSK